MSTPAIVSKGAPWSGLEDNRAGWWIDIGVEPLAQCLAEAMACSPEQLADMGQRGREWMQRDFSWQGIGVKMAETYRWLCDQSLPVPAWIKLD
jgi:glycosyltransferase involved in cell wall biosynthesis